MNVMTYFNAMLPHIQGKSIYQLFPQEYIQNLPFAQYPPFHCLRCGGQMTQDMIMPPGKVTPRAICPVCWDQITHELTETCWICGEELDDHQLFRQEASPKDIHHRIHDVGQCKDYFSLVSARAMGNPTGILEENHFLANMPENNPVIDVTPRPNQQRQITNQPSTPGNHYEPVVADESYVPPGLPFKRAQPAIIYEPRETFDDWLKQSGGTHEREKVHIVRLPKKDKG